MVRQQMKNLMLRASLGVVGACASEVCAQTDGTFLITVDGEVTPKNPTLTVGIWATWDGPDHLFGGTNYDLEASEGEFIGGTLKLWQEPPNILGLPAGRRVTGAVIGQPNLPHVWIPDPSNPILLATYEWTTTDFTMRMITFETNQTSNFILFTLPNGTTTQLFPGQFTPGSGQYFVPAPSTLLALALPLAAVRRRRCSSVETGKDRRPQ